MHARLPFQKLEIWQKSMAVAKMIHKATKQFPHDEQFGLTSQLRRAAYSVPSNIAEGSQRGTDKDFAHFLTIAKGSLAELQTQMLLAVSFEYISKAESETILQQADEIGKMIYGFQKGMLRSDR